MVHAFCGMVISYIDKDWVLREYVLDLIPLDGDHSGKSVGKLIFRHLKKDALAGCMSEHVLFVAFERIKLSYFLWRALPIMHLATGRSTGLLRRNARSSTLTLRVQETSKLGAVATVQTSSLSMDFFFFLLRFLFTLINNALGKSRAPLGYRRRSKTLICILRLASIHLCTIRRWIRLSCGRWS
jgi:hypothetical protein